MRKLLLPNLVNHRHDLPTSHLILCNTSITPMSGGGHQLPQLRAPGRNACAAGGFSCAHGLYDLAASWLALVWGWQAVLLNSHGKAMTPLGFEPTHPKIVELESTALDHSAKVS